MSAHTVTRPEVLAQALHTQYRVVLLLLAVLVVLLAVAVAGGGALLLALLVVSVLLVVLLELVELVVLVVLVLAQPVGSCPGSAAPWGSAPQFAAGTRQRLPSPAGHRSPGRGEARQGRALPAPAGP